MACHGMSNVGNVGRQTLCVFLFDLPFYSSLTTSECDCRLTRFAMCLASVVSDLITREAFQFETKKACALPC